MRNPKRLGEVVRAIKKASKKPVIIKTRIGWDAQNVNVREVAEIIEEVGADAHTIHAERVKLFIQEKQTGKLSVKSKKQQNSYYFKWRCRQW